MEGLTHIKTIQPKNYKKIINLLFTTLFDKSISLNSTTFWITGGLATETTWDAAKQSTEFISVLGPQFSEMGPELPMPLFGHCLQRINDSTAILIG